MEKKICISVVSHGQASLLQTLLDDLEKYCAQSINLILTFNIPEKIQLDLTHYTFPIKTIHNKKPKGFGENHNAAFKFCDVDYFCVLNPDINFHDNVFIKLISYFNDPRIGVVGPGIIDNNQLQDSARKFIDLKELIKRIFCTPAVTLPPDWVAGMFMLFKKDVYQAINGFDESYFLYCEDMDLCARLQEKNYKIIYDPSVKVIHAAQRSSHKKLRYLVWHIKSLVRFLWRYYFRFK